MGTQIQYAPLSTKPLLSNSCFQDSRSPGISEETWNLDVSMISLNVLMLAAGFNALEAPKTQNIMSFSSIWA